MTVSLLFYHMTRVHLEMSFAVAVILTVLALYTYYARVTELLNITPTEENEQRYKFVYLVVGILIVLVELSLCVVITSGSVAKDRSPSPRKGKGSTTHSKKT